MGHQFGRGGLIQGVVAEDGVVKANSPVFLYEREGGKFVAKTRTESDGSFAFRGLNRESSDYLVVALDPDGVSPKNALVYDRVQPVNDVAGSTWSLNWLCLAKARALVCLAAYGAELERHVPLPVYTFATSLPMLCMSGSGSIAKTSSITPGWPALEAMIFTASRYWFPGYAGSHNGVYLRPAEKYGSGGGPRPCFTLEAVPVLSTTVANGISIECTRATTTTDLDAYGAQMSGTAFCVEFTGGTTRYLRVWMHTSATQLVVSYGHNLVNTTYCSKVLELDITSLGVGAKHFIVKVDFAGDIAVYADGTLIHTLSVAALILTPPPLVNAVPLAYSENNSFPKGLVIGGIYPASAPSGTAYNSTSSVTSGTLALACLYEEAFDQDLVTAHYTALMLTTLKPVFSGYRKRVIDSQPLRYWDFSGIEGENEVHEVFRKAPSAATLYDRGNMGVALVDGPISGEKNLYVKAGQQFIGVRGGAIVNRTKFTIEAWVKKAPGKGLSLATMGKAFYSLSWTELTFHLVVAADGDVVYGERTFVTSTEFFNTVTTVNQPIPDNVWTHVVALVNTTTNRLELYINGALWAEDLVVTGNATDFMDQLSATTYLRGNGYEVDIGIGPSGLTPAGNSEGGIAHLALYSRKLSAAEILEHYQNINEA